MWSIAFVAVVIGIGVIAWPLPDESAKVRRFLLQHNHFHIAPKEKI